MICEVQGYRRKPGWIFALTWLYILLPLLTRLSLLFRQREVAFDEIFYFDWLISWMGALAIFAVSRFSIHVFAVLSGIMMALQYYAVSSGWMDLITGYGTFSVWSITTLLLIFTRAERPYLYPETRWWQQPDRYAHVMQGVLEYQTVRFPVVVLNISRDGLFLKLDERQSGGRTLSNSKTTFAERRSTETSSHPLMSAGEAAEAFSQLNAYPSQIGREVILELVPNLENAPQFRTHVLTSQAVVVWSASGRGFYRYGLGLKFIRQSKTQKKEWGDYLSKIRAVRPPKR